MSAQCAVTTLSCHTSLVLWCPAHKGLSSLQAYYAQPRELIHATEQTAYSFAKEKYCLNLPVNSKFKCQTMDPSLCLAWLHSKWMWFGFIVCSQITFLC